MNPVDQQKYLIVLGGPTASGKTDFALQLAQYYRTEIISCDSRQFYAEMSIGTAKPEQAVLDAVPHHFIGHQHISDHYSIGQFEQDALEKLRHLFQKNDIVVATGGSGMYIKALCEGLDAFPEVSPEAVQAVNDLYESQGLPALQKRLQEADPVYYGQVDLNNPARLMRALSVCLSSGEPFSSFRAGQRTPRNFHCIFLQLVWPRDALYNRINQRVDLMMQQGLLEEARGLAPYSAYNALQTVGYQEFFDYFNHQTTLQEAVELVKQHSRHYAKRQLTWMRRDGFWKKIKPADFDWAIAYIESVRSKGGVLITENKPTGLIDQRHKSLPPAVWIAWQQEPEASQAPEGIWVWKDGETAIAAPEGLDLNQEDALLLVHEAILWAEMPSVWYCDALPSLHLLEKLPFHITLPEKAPAGRWAPHFAGCRSLLQIASY